MLELLSSVIVKPSTHAVCTFCYESAQVAGCACASAWREEQDCRQLYLMETTANSCMETMSRSHAKFLNQSLLENRYCTPIFHYKRCQHVVRNSKLAMLFTKMRLSFEQVLRAFVFDMVYFMVLKDYTSLILIQNTSVARFLLGYDATQTRKKLPHVLEELATSILSAEIWRKTPKTLPL